MEEWKNHHSHATTFISIIKSKVQEDFTSFKGLSKCDLALYVYLSPIGPNASG